MLSVSARTNHAERKIYLLERPEPTLKYLETARAAPYRLRSPKKLLILLDLNGTLLVRTGTVMTPRPNVSQFLAYCLKHHTIVVWSSARRRNVSKMISQLFTSDQIPQLAAIWSREDSRLGEFFDENIQAYKQLHWLWDNPKVQASASRSHHLALPSTEQPAQRLDVWNQTNTVLVDDSLDKADSEPYNLIQIEEFTGDVGNSHDDVLGAILAYIENLAWERDVSSAIRHMPFECARGQKWDWKIGCPKFLSDQERDPDPVATQREC